MIWLTGYFDAGDHQDDQHVMAVGGYVSSVPAWLRFEKEWLKELRRVGIEEMHMTDFMSCQKEFTAWKGRESEQTQLLLRLATITKKHARKGFSGLLFLEDWRRANQEFLLKECRCTPYALCSFYVMDQAMRYFAHRTRVKLKARTVFEDGDKGKGDFMWMIDQVINRNKRMFRSIKPDFQGKELAPLQAADFAMWEQLYAEKRVIQKPDVPLVLRPSFQVLLGIKRQWGVMDYDGLLRFCADFEIPKRGEPMANWKFVPFAVSEQRVPDGAQS